MVKTKNEEIKYLSDMLSATREEDTHRLNAIGKRLIELSLFSWPSAADHLT